MSGLDRQRVFTGLSKLGKGLFAAAFLLSLILTWGGRIEAAGQQSGVGILFDTPPALAINPDEPFIPASTVKILTALIALDTLGPDYRFRTDFFLDGTTLWIKGYGDPMLVSEEVQRIAARLADLDVPKLDAIGIDESAFALEEPWQGASDNPYDAAPAALLVNFNTVYLTKENSRVRSAEPQTPTLPLMAQFAAELDEGESRRLNVSRKQETAVRYVGELFRAFLGPQAAGAAIGGGRVPADARLLYRHRSSRSLRATVAAMLRYSTNVIANQLFLTCGARVYGYPATWEQARRLARTFLDRLGVPAAACTVVEGSGLSRANRMTPRAMLAILDAFAPYRDLLPALGPDRIKSGTLAGVANYAGYFAYGDGWRPFVIFLNRPHPNRDAYLAELRRRYRPTSVSGKRSP